MYRVIVRHDGAELVEQDLPDELAFDCLGVAAAVPGAAADLFRLGDGPAPVHLLTVHGPGQVNP